jgi:hypothetical protein
LVSGQQQQIGFPVLIPTFFFGFSWFAEWVAGQQQKQLIRYFEKQLQSPIQYSINHHSPRA